MGTPSCDSLLSISRTSESNEGWLPARLDTIRIACGCLKAEVGELRRECSLVRIWGGKVVVFGGQSVLSLSKTRARIVGGFVFLEEGLTR